MENTKVLSIPSIENMENTKVPLIQYLEMWKTQKYLFITKWKCGKHKSSATLILTGVTFVFSIYWNHKSLSNLIENVKNTKPDAENNEEPLSRYVVYKVNAERMEENVENTIVYFYEGWVLAPAGLGAR